MNELISIVVPVYNVEKYLGTCVESILKQTYSNIEVILVDDGSTDCSGKMCDHYMGQDERIKVIHKKNGGLSDARNKGIMGDIFRGMTTLILECCAQTMTGFWRCLISSTNSIRCFLWKTI